MDTVKKDKELSSLGSNNWAKEDKIFNVRNGEDLAKDMFDNTNINVITIHQVKDITHGPTCTSMYNMEY